MIVRFVQHGQIDAAKWDRAILGSHFPTVFATYHLLDILVGNDTWHALISGDYHAVMPLPVRNKSFLKYIYPPFFVPQLGIFSENILSENDVTAFVEAIPKEYVLSDIVLNCANHYKFPVNNLENITSYSLNLDDSYDNLYNNFSQNVKRNITSGEKLNLIVKKETRLSDAIIRLFVANRGKEKSVNFSKNDYVRLRLIAEYFESQGLSETYGVYTETGRLAAGAIFVKDRDRIWFWFSGRDNSLSEGKPMFALINEFIKQNSNSKKTLDFNGSRNLNVARMYAGFGGKPYFFAGLRLYRNLFWEKVMPLYRLLKAKKRRD